MPSVLGLISKGGRGGLRFGQSRIEESGLGSSHTAPCGAAVPARPPTRCNKLRATPISVNGPSEPEDRVRRS
jgi:hypothetical protein